VATEQDSLLRLRFPADPRSATVLRARLALWLDELGARDVEVFEISLACSEAFANAIRHPYAPTADAIDVRAVNDETTITVVVRDYGSWSTKPTSEDGGHGFPLMRRLMDSVQVDARLDGTSITLRRRLAATRRLRVHVDDPRLLHDLCDYLTADGCLVQTLTGREATITIPGAANGCEAAETLEMELRCWEAAHMPARASLVS
jgi:anti-sigma regulatory factor (Ser/Thr protein kinase)